MKKIILFLVLLFSLFFSFNQVYALCQDGEGLVPCGNTVIYGGPDGKTPIGVSCPCEFGHFFVMLAKVYDFMVKYVATTLAVIMITVGAIFIMISAGNPNLAGTGKTMLKYAIIGLVLIFGSWIIVNEFLKMLGYQGNWYQLP